MFPTKQGTGGLRVPLVYFTVRDPGISPKNRSLVNVSAALPHPKLSVVGGSYSCLAASKSLTY